MWQSQNPRWKHSFNRDVVRILKFGCAASPQTDFEVTYTQWAFGKWMGSFTMSDVQSDMDTQLWFFFHRAFSASVDHTTLLSYSVLKGSFFHCPSLFPYVSMSSCLYDAYKWLLSQGLFKLIFIVPNLSVRTQLIFSFESCLNIYHESKILLIKMSNVFINRVHQWNPDTKANI